MPTDQAAVPDARAIRAVRLRLLVALLALGSGAGAVVIAVELVRSALSG